MRKQARVTDFKDWGEKVGYERFFQDIMNQWDAAWEEGLDPIWNSVAEKQRQRFERGLVSARGKDVTLFSKHWDVSSGRRLRSAPISVAVSSDNDILMESRWAARWSGKALVYDYDETSGDCQLDASAFPPIERIEAPLLFIGGHANWAHWLFDVLPMVMTLEKLGRIDERKIAIVDMGPAQLETLDLIGITEERRVVLPLSSHATSQLECADLELANAPPLLLSTNWMRERFSKNAGPELSPLPERVYLSRKSFFPCHRVGNQEELERHLERIGFTIINPEEHGVADFIRLMSRVEIVIATPGAATGNCLFAPNDAVIIQMLPDSMNVDFRSAPLMKETMSYYFPFLDRMFFVYGSTSSQQCLDHVQKHGEGVLGIDVPGVYDLSNIDIALMMAEKTLRMLRR